MEIQSRLDFAIVPTTAFCYRCSGDQKKMKIELRLFASLSRFLPDIKDPECLNALEIEEGTTIRTLLDRLKFPHGQPTIIFLNGVHAGKNAVLKDGDRLGIFPPLAGG